MNSKVCSSIPGSCRGSPCDIEIYLRKNRSVWVISMDSEVTMPDQAMASMTLKQHRSTGRKFGRRKWKRWRMTKDQV